MHIGKSVKGPPRRVKYIFHYHLTSFYRDENIRHYANVREYNRSAVIKNIPGTIKKDTFLVREFYVFRNRIYKAYFESINLTQKLQNDANKTFSYG